MRRAGRQCPEVLRVAADVSRRIGLPGLLVVLGIAAGCGQKGPPRAAGG